MVPTVSSLLIPVDYFSRNGASPQSFNRGDQFLFRFNFISHFQEYPITFVILHFINKFTDEFIDLDLINVL